MIKNGDRIILKIMRELCAELDIQLRTYCKDWVIELKKGSRREYIWGYQMLNGSAEQLICKDKSATAEILNSNSVKAVEHNLFIVPTEISYVGMSENWREMSALLKKYGKAVVKNNEGTGGADVYAVSSQGELESAVHTLFKNYRTISISPFYDIEKEYRVICFKGKPLLTFEKNRRFVIGDGRSEVLELAARKYGNVSVEDIADPCKVPAEGEKTFISWKHNLGRGAQAELVGGGSEKEVEKLAAEAAALLNLKAAAVDVIKVGDELLVLEVNSGLMTENFASESVENCSLTKEIYRACLKEMFKE